MSVAGKVIQVAGPAVDVEFPEGQIPVIRTAIRITSEGYKVPDPIDIICEVAQHIGESRVRTIALQPTDGLVRETAEKITRGEKGMSLIEESSPRSLHVPATGFEVTYARVGQPGVDRSSTGRQVFDVTGAGDTVLSVLALAAAAGASLPDAAVLANAAAGVVVSKLGTATVTPQELTRALDDI